MIAHGSTPHARWVGLAVLVASGCDASPEVLTNRAHTVRIDEPALPEIHCTATPTNDGRTTIHYEIRNRSSRTIHILNGRHMPYQLAPDANTLVVLQGVNRPNPSRLYNITEIPLTRPLATGEAFTGDLVWPKETLRDHFDAWPTPASLMHGIIHVHCEVGWGATPIIVANRWRMSIPQFFDWQQVTVSVPFNVVLP